MNDAAAAMLATSDADSEVRRQRCIAQHELERAYERSFAAAQAHDTAGFNAVQLEILTLRAKVKELTARAAETGVAAQRAVYAWHASLPAPRPARARAPLPPRPKVARRARAKRRATSARRPRPSSSDPDPSSSDEPPLHEVASPPTTLAERRAIVGALADLLLASIAGDACRAGGGPR